MYRRSAKPSFITRVLTANIGSRDQISTRNWQFRCGYHIVCRFDLYPRCFTQHRRRIRRYKGRHQQGQVKKLKMGHALLHGSLGQTFFFRGGSYVPGQQQKHVIMSCVDIYYVPMLCGRDIGLYSYKLECYVIIVIVSAHIIINHVHTCGSTSAFW